MPRVGRSAQTGYSPLHRDMDAWVWWTVIACILAAGEVMNTSFFLAPFAVGAAVAAIAAAVGLPLAGALAFFLATSVAMLLIVRPIARRHLYTPPQIRTGTAADRTLGRRPRADRQRRERRLRAHRERGLDGARLRR